MNYITPIHDPSFERILQFREQIAIFLKTKTVNSASCSSGKVISFERDWAFCHTCSLVPVITSVTLWILAKFFFLSSLGSEHILN